jgi:hypothetical protein
MELRVASTLASFSTSGAQASRPRSSSRTSQRGCELPRILHPQAVPATDSRVASRLSSFSASSSEAQVSPRFNSPFAPLDASPGLPRLLHLPALPAMDLRVAPNLASFSASVASTPGRPAVSPFQLRLPMHLPGCPGTCIFRLCRRRTLELPRVSRPSAHLVLVLRVAPRPRASSCASRHGCELPRTPHLPALPRV